MIHFDSVYLATDDDDDGEEIAWHVMQIFIECGFTDTQKIKRMRFYSLTGDEIRRAKKNALPGIDAKRVRSSLLKKIQDSRLHRILQSQNIHCSRPEIALLHEISFRNKTKPTWRIQVKGKMCEEHVAGYLLTTQEEDTHYQQSIQVGMYI